MGRYLISFNDGAMDHIAREDIPAVGDDVRVVMREAKAAGAWVFGAGLERQQAQIVGIDGTVTDGPYPETKEVVGGFVVLDADTREEALVWAAKIAKACQCAQEVREMLFDPES